MAANTVEATLRSRYEDGVTKGVEQTERVLRQGFAGMQHAGVTLVSAFGSLWESILGQLRNYRLQIRQTADESDSQFKRMGLAGVAFSLLLAEALLRVGSAIGRFVF